MWTIFRTNAPPVKITFDSTGDLGLICEPTYLWFSPAEVRHLRDVLNNLTEPTPIDRFCLAHGRSLEFLLLALCAGLIFLMLILGIDLARLAYHYDRYQPLRLGHQYGYYDRQWNLHLFDRQDVADLAAEEERMSKWKLLRYVPPQPLEIL